MVISGRAQKQAINTSGHHYNNQASICSGVPWTHVFVFSNDDDDENNDSQSGYWLGCWLVSWLEVHCWLLLDQYASLSRVSTTPS